MKTKFLKPHLSYKEQLNLLKNRNLNISNEAYALNKLKHISYYRLSAYFLPYYKKDKHFIENTTFEDIVKLYYFDKELKNLIFTSIEKIEIYLRTQLSYTISKDFGSFGYTTCENFHNKKDFIPLMSHIQKEVNRSKEIFVKSFFNNYIECNLPVWMMIETVSFGTISKIYKNLYQKQRAEVIKELDIPANVFESWLHSLIYVRNICAHHSRLWNKILGIKPLIPRKIPHFKEISNNKIFIILSILQYLLIKIDDEELQLKNNILSLLKEFPNISIENMGFTQNWQDLALWKDY